MIDFSQYFEWFAFLPLLAGACVAPMLFLNRTFNELTSEWDILYLCLPCGYGCIMSLYGWRLDPILLFSQILLLVYAIIMSFFYTKLRFNYFMLRQLVEKDEHNEDWAVLDSNQ